MSDENRALGVLLHLPTPTNIIATQIRFSFHLCTHKLLLLFHNLVANVGWFSHALCIASLVVALLAVGDLSYSSITNLIEDVCQQICYSQGE